MNEILLKYTDVMFDIETLSANPDAPILSIAAVPFNVDSGIVLPKEQCFHQHVKLEDELRLGTKPSASTLMWWLEQSVVARLGLVIGQNSAAHTEDVALWLHNFLRANVSDLGKMRVWGNGANFDITLLEAFFRRAEEELPWKFYNVRCYRTLKNLKPEACLWKPKVKHDALEDAYAQALNCISVVRSLPVVAADV